MSKKKCIYCGKWFKSLGLASHRAACSKKNRQILGINKEGIVYADQIRKGLR